MEYSHGNDGTVLKDRRDPAAFDGGENLDRAPRLRSKSRCQRQASSLGCYGCVVQDEIHIIIPSEM